jgi:hypothetical protein
LAIRVVSRNGALKWSTRGLWRGVHLGVGLTGRHHTRHVFLEVLVHANLTDHGAGDYAIGYFFPVVAGVRF